MNVARTAFLLIARCADVEPRADLARGALAGHALILVADAAARFPLSRLSELVAEIVEDHHRGVLGSAKCIELVMVALAEHHEFVPVTPQIIRQCIVFVLGIQSHVYRDL